MPVNSPSDYFPREIVLNILTSCDTFQPLKLYYPHPKNNKWLYELVNNQLLVIYSGNWRELKHILMPTTP